jgi:hypothetical protein
VIKEHGDANWESIRDEYNKLISGKRTVPSMIRQYVKSYLVPLLFCTLYTQFFEKRMLTFMPDTLSILKKVTTALSSQ